MSLQFTELDHQARRQLIDSETAFLELQRTRRERAQRNRSAFEWVARADGDHLVNTATPAHSDLGVRNETTQGIFEKARLQREAVEARLRALTQQSDTNERLNAALRVGRCHPAVVSVLDVLEQEGLGDQFLTVGTHALYAYESAAGVRFTAEAMATQDIDLLVNMEARLQISTTLKDRSFLSLLQKADPTFIVREGQRETAVNSQGFEVDVIRRLAKDDDPHPWRMSEHEDDLWPVRVSTGQKLGSVGRFSQMVVGVDGKMAMMNTVDPAAFVAVKRALSQKSDRDPRKASKDALQVEIVQALMDRYRIEHASRPIVSGETLADELPEPPKGSLRARFSPK